VKGDEQSLMNCGKPFQTEDMRIDVEFTEQLGLPQALEYIQYYNRTYSWCNSG